MNTAEIDLARTRLRSDLKRRRIVFVQSSFLHGTYFDEIVSGLESRIELEATDFCGLDRNAVAAAVGHSSVIIIRAVETLGLNGVAESFGALRERVYWALAEDVDVCLVSANSQTSYMHSFGSSIIAIDSFPHVLQLDAGAEQHDGTVCGRLPVVRAGLAENLLTIFGHALSQISIEALIEIEHAIFDLKLNCDRFIPFLSSRTRVELCSAGFCYTIGAGTTAQFVDRKGFSYFRQAIGDTVSDLYRPPSWMDTTFAGLFKAERLIRSKVRRAAMGERGGRWRRGLLSVALEGEVIRRCNAAGNFAFTTIADVRDPLEWLTLGELLLLIRGKQLLGLGLPDAFWSRFDLEITPIRNRLGHMRLIGRGDERTVAQWLRILELKLT